MDMDIIKVNQIQVRVNSTVMGYMEFNGNEVNTYFSTWEGTAQGIEYRLVQLNNIKGQVIGAIESTDYELFLVSSNYIGEARDSGRVFVELPPLNSMDEYFNMLNSLLNG